MAILTKGDLLQRYNRRQTTLVSDDGEKSFSKGRLLEASRTFDAAACYDIFLSHSYDDARIVKVVKEMLEERGHSVYVDWFEDDHLDRERVTEHTANILRQRMNRCASLLYLTSPAARRSLWMPWELGYMDARTGRIAVAPILDDNEEFDGREYLGLYSYLDIINDRFYVHRSPSVWVMFDRWMAGEILRLLCDRFPSACSSDQL